MSATVGEGDAPWALVFSQVFRGNALFAALKTLGYRTLLVTAKQWLDAPWDKPVIDEIFALPRFDDLSLVRNGVAYLLRSRRFEKVFSVDDPGVELTAHVREFFQLPGMGETTARRFRDKLAMRRAAREAGVPVPDFSSTFHDADVNAFLSNTQGPWLVKPRSEFLSKGIQRVADRDAAWRVLDALGDARAGHLIERYVPGDVFHVDSVISDGKVRFAEAHGYQTPLLDVVQSGGMMVTATVEHGSALEGSLLDANKRVLAALGHKHGVAHTELIVGRADNTVYFLESAARVAGAAIPELVEATTGVNLWREYARVELMGASYEPPERKSAHGALLAGLAKTEHPSFHAVQGPSTARTLNLLPYQAGLILREDDPAKLREVLAETQPRFVHDVLGVR